MRPSKGDGRGKLIGTRLFDAGYTDLVCVIPPGAELSPGSKINPSQLGKTPGRKYTEGWGGYGWLEHEPTRKEVMSWDANGANIGLKGRRFPGLDIDSDDQQITAVVEALALRHLGPAPVRLSTGHRRLWVFRTDEPFSRMALVVKRGDRSHLIEFLGEGKQYLVHGRHPSGAEYRWRGSPLWLKPPKTLTKVTRASVEEFFARTEAFFKSQGLQVERLGTGATNKEAPPIEDLMAPSIEALKRLPLPPNPPHYGWDEFIKHGYAYAAAAADDPEVGFELWDRWAQQSDKYDAEETRRQWEKGFYNPRVGWSWLVEQAELTGEYVSAQDEFEVLAPAEKEKEEVLPTFLTLAQLQERPELLEPPACVIPRIAYRGRLTILAGPDKAGKSTLLGHGIAALSSGRPFLGEDYQARHNRAVLLGLEEALQDPVQRLTELEANPHNVLIVARPDKKLLDRARVWLERWPADVIVIDSLQEYARVTQGSAPDDGDNAGWAKVVRPLVQLARDLDIAVVVLHHVRRSDGQFRAAGEIAAAADALLEMRWGPASEPDTRLISGRGRWRVEPFRVTLRNGEYVLDDGLAPLSLRDRVINFVAGNPGVTKNGLRQGVGANHDAVDEVLEGLIEDGVVENRGKGNAHRYYLTAGAKSALDVVDGSQAEDEE